VRSRENGPAWGGLGGSFHDPARGRGVLGPILTDSSEVFDLRTAYLEEISPNFWQFKQPKDAFREQSACKSLRHGVREERMTW